MADFHFLTSQHDGLPLWRYNMTDFLFDVTTWRISLFEVTWRISLFWRHNMADFSLTSQHGRSLSFDVTKWRTSLFDVTTWWTSLWRHNIADLSLSRDSMADFSRTLCFSEVSSHVWHLKRKKVTKYLPSCVTKESRGMALINEGQGVVLFC